MNIWRPEPSKLSQLSANNPHYWQLCVSRSQYSEEEIVSSLQEVEKINDELQSFKAKVYYQTLTDENGEMSTLKGFASEAHKRIYEAMYYLDYIQPDMSENSHRNCFPVAKWNKQVSQLRKQIAKVQKLVSKI